MKASYQQHPSLCMSFGRDTLSNARAKSMWATKVSIFESKFSVHSFRHSNRFRQVECLDLKLCWLSDNKFFSSRNGTSTVFITDSKILLPTQVKDIGL